MAGCLDRTGLMHVDMSGGSSYHALMRTQRRTDHRQIRLRPADQKMHRRILSAAKCTDFFSGTLTINILTVARCLHQVRFHQALHNLRNRTLQIIALKAKLFLLLFCVANFFFLIFFGQISFSFFHCIFFHHFFHLFSLLLFSAKIGGFHLAHCS